MKSDWRYRAPDRGGNAMGFALLWCALMLFIAAGILLAIVG